MTVNIGKVIYVINGIYAVKQLSNHKRNDITVIPETLPQFKLKPIQNNRVPAVIATHFSHKIFSRLICISNIR